MCANNVSMALIAMILGSLGLTFLMPQSAVETTSPVPVEVLGRGHF